MGKRWKKFTKKWKIPVDLRSTQHKNMYIRYYWRKTVILDLLDLNITRISWPLESNRHKRNGKLFLQFHRTLKNNIPYSLTSFISYTKLIQINFLINHHCNSNFLNLCIKLMVLVFLASVKLRRKLLRVRLLTNNNFFSNILPRVLFCAVDCRNDVEAIEVCPDQHMNLPFPVWRKRKCHIHTRRVTWVTFLTGIYLSHYYNLKYH